MITKSMPAKIKAAGEQDGLNEGEFRALVSVFGNKDSYGDIVQPGAFKDTLAEWAASGDPIPVYWSHQMSDPDMNLGHVIKAEETDAGLEVHAALDLASPKAQQVYRLMKGRRVTQMSFSYDVVEGGWKEMDLGDGFKDEYYSLDKLKLYEVGPTPIGANQETELLDVKSARESTRRFVENLTAGVKAGRVLSAKNETTLRDAQSSLKDALEMIDGVLSALQDDDDGKAANVSGSPLDEARKGKSDGARRPSAADLLALHTIQLSEIG